MHQDPHRPLRPLPYLPPCHRRERIEWASDTVKVKVSPHTELAGHKLDFIELDGSVSLSLQVVGIHLRQCNRHEP